MGFGCRCNATSLRKVARSCTASELPELHTPRPRSNIAAPSTAFQNVADTLNALQQDAEALRTASAAKDAAAITLELAKKQYQTLRC